jgi:hypothetical protein
VGTNYGVISLLALRRLSGSLMLIRPRIQNLVINRHAVAVKYPG